MTRMQDRKVTVSINPALIALVDEYVEKHSKLSRSAVFEQALVIWYKQLLEQADIEYYTSQTEAELASNQSWSEVTTAAAEQIWK